MTDLDAAAAFTKSWRHQPRYQAAPSPTITWPGSTLGKPCCQGYTTEIGSNFTMRHQCSRQGRVQTADGVWWCNTHSPPAVAKRNAKRAAEQAVKDAANRARWDKIATAAAQAESFPRLLTALQQIADGHNDATALARQTLASLPEALQPKKD